ncbi:MAG: hypothetical protein ACOX6E_07420 [Syntrophomonadaceae bacterium]|jgi:hypothetical protein
MSFINFLSTKKLMSYEINMCSDLISVKVMEENPELSNHEYVRMWAFYHCKVMDNLGYPYNETANLLNRALYKIISKKFDKNIDCFERAGLSDQITYSDQFITPKVTFKGEYYSKASKHRRIKTKFPLVITEQQVLHSSIGLLQFTINKCSNKKKELDMIYKVIFFLLVGYEADTRTVKKMLILRPETAYYNALETNINEIYDKYITAF